MARPVSFLSDFGIADEFVGVVHGVIARIAPGVRVLDVTHGIRRGDVQSGALALLRAVQYLPNGVVLAVVDPGVGTDRAAIAVETEWGFLVGPDNGLLAPAVAMVGGAGRAVRLEDPRFRLPGGGDTFAGRDVFAPAAAVLASGEASLDDLGPDFPVHHLTPLLLPLPSVEGEAVRGEVVWEDGFGNLQTNVSPEDLAAIGAAPGHHLVLDFGIARHGVPWAAAYGDVGEGELLAHVDSAGQIAVAVRGGSAAATLGIGVGRSVTIRSVPEAPR